MAKRSKTDLHPLLADAGIIRNRAKIDAATALRASAHQLTVLHWGLAMLIGPPLNVPTSANTTCRPNQMARFAITPTTAAVMALSAPDRALLDCRRSM